MKVSAANMLLVLMLSLLTVFVPEGEASRALPTVSETPPAQREATASKPTLLIRKIIFSGNKALDEKRLLELTSLSPGQVFIPDFVKNSLDRVLAEYKRLGYLFAKIDWQVRWSGNDQVILQIEITEGNRIRMGKIHLSGNSVFSDRLLLSKMDISRYGRFDESVFQADVERILEAYSDNGHPLAKISLTGFRIQDNRLTLDMHIDEGPVVRIGQIRVSGISKTKRRVLLREIAIEPGDIFDQRRIDESKRRLENLGYFQSVLTSFEPMDSSSAESGSVKDVILDFVVEERRTGEFNGVIGYDAAANSSGTSRLSGLIEVSDVNLAGTGRKLALRGRFGHSDSYELNYEEPWIFGKPVDIGLRLWGVSQDTQDSGVEAPATWQETQYDGESESGNGYGLARSKERAASISASTGILRNVDGSAAITYKWIKSPVYGYDGSFESPSPAGTGEKYSLTLTVKRDTRDYFANPICGRLDRYSMEISRGDFRTFRLWLDFNQYLETRHRQVLAIGIHGARVWGRMVPFTEMLYLGGANSLRGYAESFFRGEGTALVNNEYRFLVSRESQFFLFIDVGSVYNKGSGFSPLKVGFGLGMRLRSDAGLVNLDYGLAKGDSVLGGKIHVSLGAMF